MKTRLAIIFCVLLLASLSCRVFNQVIGAPVAYIRVGADPTVSISPSELDQAREILQARLDNAPLHGKATAVVDGNSVRVDLTDASDLEAAAGLVNQRGAVDFVRSEDELIIGSKVPEGLPVILTDADLKLVTYYTDTANKPAIFLEFTPEGTKKLAEFTAENIDIYLAVVQDGIVVSSPRIATEIKDGSAIITGKFTLESANELIVILRAGRLPFQPVLLETKLVK
jgi:preprotein translocase subunit SecD